MSSFLWVAIYCAKRGPYRDLLAPTRSTLAATLAVVKDYSTSPNWRFSVDPNPKLSKTKCIYYGSYNCFQVQEGSKMAIHTLQNIDKISQYFQMMQYISFAKYRDTKRSHLLLGNQMTF